MKFAAAAGASSLAALRAMTAEQIQDAARQSAGRPLQHGHGRLLPREDAHGDLARRRAGQGPAAGGFEHRGAGERAAVLGGGDPTPETLANAIRKFYGDKAEPVLKAYAATTTDEVFEAATHLASARFISYGTWKWTELQMQTGGKPVYRYLYARVRPAYLGMPGRPPAAPAPGRGDAAAGRGAAAASGASRRRAFRRDPVRHGQPRPRQALRVGACRLRSLEDHAGVTS